MNELLNIKDVVQTYVTIASDMTGAYVEVIDSNMEKVATSFTEDEALIDNSISTHKVILNTVEQVVIEEPKIDLICEGCEIKNNCDITYKIITPIIKEDETIGVINIVSKDDIIKNRLIENLELYKDFICQFSELIAMKVTETEAAENRKAMVVMLKIIIQNMDEGAIIIDSKGQINTINQSAKKQLGITRLIKNEAIEIKYTGDNVNDSSEFIIKIGNKTSKVFGEIFKIPKNKNYDKVLLFRDLKKVQSNFYEMTSTINIADTESIIGSSKKTMELKENILKVADSISTVLITGESGTGKEMVATAIWKNSDRRDKQFVAINCAAIPESLLESELFGYVKGAFTGADPKGKIGKFELANNGVIFLDEIGDMPLYLQSKLLRVIQDKKITRIGSNQIIPLDVRIIAATNKDLKKMIRENQFREDLYYRLNVIPIEIPPLRERKADIVELTEHFIEHYRKMFGKNFNYIDDRAMKTLIEYPWPGNVRELENVVEYMVNMMEDGIIDMNTLPKNIFDPLDLIIPDKNLIKPLEALEREEIEKAIKLFGDTTRGKEQAAKSLGIGIATLYRKLQNIEKQTG